MLKEIKGSAVFEANATIYIIGKNAEELNKWRNSEAKPPEVTPVVDRGSVLMRSGLIICTNLYDCPTRMNACSDGLCTESMDYQLVYRVQYLVIAEDGRTLPPELKDSFKREVMAMFSNVCTGAGAVYMAVDMDGEKTHWYNDESYYHYSKHQLKGKYDDSNFLKDFHVWVSGLSEDQKKEMVNSAIKKASGEGFFSDKISKTEEEKLASETRNFLLNYLLKA